MSAAEFSLEDLLCPLVFPSQQWRLSFEWNASD
jgi:hypothetical protein